jgi:O-antigen ligase
MYLYTSVAVFLFSAIALAIPSGFSFGAVLLLGGSAILPWKRVKPGLKTADQVLIVVLVQYFVICVLANLIHHEIAREYDIPSRFVLVIPALLLLLAYPPNPTAIWSGLAVGAIAAGVFAGWQSLDMGIIRADGFTNPIQFGNISLLLGMLCLAGLAWANSHKRAQFWNGFMLTGAAMGTLGSIFTGSRGSWISLPFCLFVLYRCHGGVLGRRRVIAGLFGIAIVFATLYAIPRTDVKARVQAAIAETNGYFKNGNTETSSGARLEMWRIGFMIFPQHPWLGWGKQGYMNKKEQLIEAGQASPIIREHTHLHNEYLDALVKRGLPGLASVLLLYLAPLLLFAREMKRAGPKARPYAVAGMLLVICYLGFGLTQAFLTHNNGVTMFAFLLAVFWTSLRGHEHEGLNDPQAHAWRKR